MNIHSFKKRKSDSQKISMVTCYDYTSAQIASQTEVDCLLVGDSVAMVMHGYANTLAADTAMIALHTRAVANGAAKKWIVADMPFCSYRKGLVDTVSHAETLMRAGAHSVKLEGAVGNLEVVRHLVNSGIPVMGHLGLTPQAIHTLGGFKVQGREASHIDALCEQARQLEQAGCFALVLECIPALGAKKITEALTIPTIGIGAGPHTDGQVLVWQDLMGLNPDFKAKFVKTYESGFERFAKALNDYDNEVKAGTFPDVDKHCFK